MLILSISVSMSLSDLFRNLGEFDSLYIVSFMSINYLIFNINTPIISIQSAGFSREGFIEGGGLIFEKFS